MIACPNCGANLKFNPKSQMMKCEFCDSEFDPALYEEKKDAEEHKVTEDTDTYDVTIYTCPQCGGELMSVDDNTAAAFCSFCGASTILNSRLSKGKKPDFIIPFSKTKEDCKNAYLSLMKKSLFAPAELKKEEYIDSFRGIYMPYWSYEVENKGLIRLKGETSSRKGDYIITKHYALSGNIDAEYEGISFDAASNFDDSISERIAPFDVHDRVPFNVSYMSGYYADVADVSEKVYEKDAKEFACTESFQKIKTTRDFKPYSIKDPNHAGQDIPSRIKNVSATMNPVWFLAYRNGDRVAYATVNGQTGKVAADMPVDYKKYIIGSLILAVFIFVFFNMFLTLTPAAMLRTATVLTIFVLFLNAFQRMNIAKMDEGVDDKGKLSKALSAKKKSKGAFLNEMKKEEKILSIVAMAAVVISAFTILSASIHDEIYYFCCIADAFIFIFDFKFTLENYNVMATRRLPQFDRKGGDDRA